MKLNKWMKLLIIGSSILSLTACHHKQAQNQMSDNANDEYLSHRSPQSSGLGNESGFGQNDELVSNRTYYFDYDSYIVRSANMPAIVANAQYLHSHPSAKVLLEGHTDPRGSREYNIGLGERRAKAVGDVLVAKGASPAQIRIVSYGAEKLAIPGHTETAFEKDRRVVLVYLRK